MIHWLQSIKTECTRYRISGIAMITCLVISMLASQFGILIFRNILNESHDTNRYDYKYTINLSTEIQSKKDIPNLTSDLNCNIKIPWVMAYDNACQTSRICTVIVSSYKEKYPLLSGQYADSAMLEAGTPIILIGKNDVKYAYKNNNHLYYKLFGQPYQVIGILGSETSSIFDDSIVLYLDCLGSNLEQSLLDNGKAGITITLESDQSDVDEIYTQYLLPSYKIKKEIAARDSSSYLSSSVPFRNEAEYCAIIFLFCFICLSIVIRFWLTQRIHEMKIRRAFGYSNGQLLFCLIRSILSIVLVSSLIFLICLLLLHTFQKNLMEEYHLFFSFDIAIIYCGIFLFSLLLICVRPIYLLLKEGITARL